MKKKKKGKKKQNAILSQFKCDSFKKSMYYLYPFDVILYFIYQKIKFNL